MINLEHLFREIMSINPLLVIVLGPILGTALQLITRRHLILLKKKRRQYLRRWNKWYRVKRNKRIVQYAQKATKLSLWLAVIITSYRLL